ncbi:hypothetical protein [Caulobacter sp. DWR1-3-2b1]|uniref:hypothetical protein n=1 Tax=Caulobacter sp. DWR1-3-2b1 TaxID=2804670 RepID=UPI003CF6AF8D
MSIHLDSAEAVSCDNICKGVTLAVTVENRSTRPVCFSIRYINRIVGAIFIASPGSESGDGFLVDSEALDPVPNTPDHASEFASMLKSEPNVYVAPGGKMTYSASTGDRFEIPKMPLIVNLGMYISDCEGGEFKRLSSSHALTFPSR